MMTRSDSTRKWKFFKAGGVEQVLLRNGADIAALGELDQKLWVALAMPVRGVDFDARTLELIDSDGDGRIRAPEVIEAVRWIAQALKNLDLLLTAGDAVPLSDIRDEALIATAKRLGAQDCVRLDEVTHALQTFADQPLNGDGVVTPESTSDGALKSLIELITATLGGIPDRSAKAGVDQARAERFFAEAKGLLAWADARSSEAGVPEIAELLHGLKPKIDDYFIRCRLAAFDGRAAGALNRAEADYLALADQELSLAHAAIARFPLSLIEKNRALPLVGESLNPVWAAQAIALGEHLGMTSLTEADWAQLQSRFAAHEAWHAAKPTTPLHAIDLARLREVMKLEQPLLELIASDKHLEAELLSLTAVERMVRYRRDLFRLLSNFVSFSDFYSCKGAVFQAGTLYLDARMCSLCIEVVDPDRHGALAGLAATYLAYCDCNRPGGAHKTIVAAFTDGDADNLTVGRNGIFYDRNGQDWDARITKIVSNPISVRQAFWSPYKKLGRLVDEQIGKRAAASDSKATDRLETAATTAANADTAKPLAPKKIDVGTVAAIGVAVGAIGAMISGLFASFFGLGIWMPLGVLAVLGAISGPSMIMAYMKLRQRNLGPLLDASGWAINGRARINVPFGAALTSVAKLPARAEVARADPYAEKQTPWKTCGAVAVALALGLLWYTGNLDNLLPQSVQRSSVLEKKAPSAKEDPAPPAEGQKPLAEGDSR